MVFTTEPPFELTAADGWFLHDAAGTRLLDLTSGWNVTNAGWNCPAIDRAWAAQGAASWFRPSWCDNSQLEALHQRLALIAPRRRVIPSCTGSDAVDNALKIARLITGRAGVIRFEGAYHGSGTGAALATGYHVPHLEPLWPAAATLDLPLPDAPDAVARAERAIRGFAEAGALLFEPVLTNMACRVLSDDYRAMLSRVCAELGIILIADEVGTGINRLGKFYATLDAANETDEPDIVVSAKALTNGLYPLSLCLVRDRLARHLDDAAFASTYAAMPSGCAAAVATIDAHLSGNFGDLARETGAVFAAALREATTDLPGVRMLCGTGLELALHLDWKLLRQRGLTPYGLLERLRTAGLFATLSPGEDHLMLMPPLVTPPELLIAAASTIAEVIRSS